MKRTIAVIHAFFLGSLLMMATSAQAYNGYYHPSYEKRQNPVETIQSALDKLKTFSTNRDTVNPVMLRSFIENEIIPHFAFDQMTYWIAGPMARQMSTEELDDLEERVKQTFLKSLAKHLGSYDAETTQIRFRSPEYRRSKEATVNAVVFRKDVPPAKLEFRMRAHGDSWKIIDVKANGTSAVIYYRKHFMSNNREQRGNREKRGSRELRRAR